MVDGRILAGGVLAVVTAFACVCNTLVIKHASGKTVSVMTHPAILGGRYMVSRLTNSCRAVMATGAIAGEGTNAVVEWQ